MFVTSTIHQFNKIYFSFTKPPNKPHLILARTPKSERKPRIPLQKHDPNEKMAPIFIEKPENKVVIENSVDFIEAIVDGNPFPSVTWYKGARECFDGPKFSFENDSESGVVTMHMNKPKMDDEAKYSLRIYNDSGEDRATFSIFVRCNSIYLPYYHRLLILLKNKFFFFLTLI